MDRKQARRKYWNQRKMAALRGIRWDLTFQQWVEWWGADIDRRGSRADQLQMQRIADTGPYALHNIRKGYPRDNSRTVSLMRQTKQTLRLARELEAARESDPGKSPGPDEVDEDSEWIEQHVGFHARRCDPWEPRY